MRDKPTMKRWSEKRSKMMSREGLVLRVQLERLMIAWVKTLRVMLFIDSKRGQAISPLKTKVLLKVNRISRETTKNLKGKNKVLPPALILRLSEKIFNLQIIICISKCLSNLMIRYLQNFKWDFCKNTDRWRKVIYKNFRIITKKIRMKKQKILINFQKQLKKKKLKFPSWKNWKIKTQAACKDFSIWESKSSIIEYAGSILWLTERQEKKKKELDTITEMRFTEKSFWDFLKIGKKFPINGVKKELQVRKAYSEKIWRLKNSQCGLQKLINLCFTWLSLKIKSSRKCKRESTWQSNTNHHWTREWINLIRRRIFLQTTL